VRWASAMNEEAAATPQEEHGVEGATTDSMGALPFPRTMSVIDLDGEAPTLLPEARNLPSDDDELKRSQFGRSSPAPLEGVSDGDTAAASRLRAERGLEGGLDEEEGPLGKIVSYETRP
jgi:hypothetical protein